MLGDELIAVHENARTVAPFTDRQPGLTPAEGYRAAKQSDAAPLAAGELISTGTLTDAHPVAPGETWSTEIRGIGLEGLEVTFA